MCEADSVPGAAWRIKVKQQATPARDHLSKLEPLAHRLSLEYLPDSFKR
jgi:hypothetical protein